MALIFDPVSDAVDKFMARRGSAVVESAIRAALGLSNRIEMLGPDARQLNREAVASTLDRVHSLGTELCARNSFGRLLLLFRKVRHEVTIPLFQQWYSVSTKEIGTLLEQATIYGTNAILQFARHDDDVFVDYSARYRLQPEAEEISDALRLVVYAVVHRHLMFIANTDARRPFGL